MRSSPNIFRQHSWISLESTSGLSRYLSCISMAVEGAEVSHQRALGRSSLWPQPLRERVETVCIVLIRESLSGASVLGQDKR